MLNLDESIKIIQETKTIHDLIHNIKPKITGKGSLIEDLNSQIRTALPEQKKEIGKKLSELRSIIETEINNKLLLLEEEQLNIRLLSEKIDGSLPSRIRETGLLHPITMVANEIIDIFKIYGFELNSGFEIEDDWHNFTALNIPEHHPARQMHDTFYMNDKKMVLRTHTTSVDIRALIKKGAPLKAISFGKTFRCDSDKTHSPMFHQFELLQVGENLSMADLKGHILSFLRAFFGKNNIEIRLRPSFFPFTEPSAEVDIGYCIRDGKIVIGEETEKFMEILGCGMLHPFVLENCKIDSKKYNGIALGMGVERMAMLKYGINDLRKFFESDLNWLKQNAFVNL